MDQNPHHGRKPADNPGLSSRYGWVVVAYCTILMMAGFGIYYSFSVFFASLQAEFGWTRARTSSVFSLYLVFSGVFSIVAGRVLDQYGPRVVVLILGVVTGVSLFLMSGIQASWELYLYYSVLLSLGTGPIYIVAMSTASRWFEKKRGTAVGIVGAGAGLGSVLLSPFSAWLIADYSWRQAYLVLGFVAVAVMVPAGLLMKQPSAEPVRSLPGNPTGHPRSDAPRFSPMNAMGSGTFRIFFTIWFCYSFCLHLVMGHIVPKAQDLGMDSISAAAAMSLLTATVIPCRLLAGIFSDMVAKRHLFIAMALAHLMVMGWLAFSTQPWMVFVFAVLFGVVYGTIDPPVISMVGDSFGTTHLGSIMGLLMVAWGVGSAVGPYFGGLIFDHTGGYAIAFIIGGLAMGLTALLGYRLKR